MASLERQMRRFQEAHVTKLVNMDEIRPRLAPLYRDVKLPAFFDDPSNICIVKAGGAMLFAAVKDGPPGFYDVHYVFPRKKGRAVLDAARACVDEMFAKHGARVLCGLTPRDNRAARIINRALGSRPVGDGIDSQGRHCIFYVLERAAWIARKSEPSSATTLSRAS